MNRQDDPTLTGDIRVYRRIPPQAERVQWNEKSEPIPSSQNFSDAENELSVFMVSQTTPEAVLENNDGCGLVTLALQDFRDAYADAQPPRQVVICRDDSGGVGHILVCGKASPKIRNTLKDRAIWVPGFWPRRLPENA